MSRYGAYSGIDGETAFLCGAVSAASDCTLEKVLPRFWTAYTDVFKTDIEGLAGNMRERFGVYMSQDKNTRPDGEDVTDDLSFEIRPSGSQDIRELIEDVIKRHKERLAKDKEDLLSDFERQLKLYLGKPRAFYRLATPLGTPETAVLERFYAYVVFDIMFIEYEEHVVMIVLGSDE